MPESSGNLLLIHLVTELELPEEIAQLELSVDRLFIDGIFGSALDRQNIFF
jgi:hypothetical protein